jgi:hypothetical protein
MKILVRLMSDGLVPGRRVRRRTGRRHVLSDNFLTVREGNLDNALVGFSVNTARGCNNDGNNVCS